MREWLGVWIKDRWRYERALLSSDHRYLALANRRERLDPAPDGIGFVCVWEFTSRLHAPTIQPRLGQRLLRRCLNDAPIRLIHLPPQPTDQPQISVLIGHRGLERLPLLLATLESLAAQTDVAFECVVIEQDEQPRIAQLLPGWVRYMHTKPPRPGAPYNRSRAFNAGALQARAPVLLLHDNDMLVPCGYLRRILEKVALGYQAVNPKRYVFYLCERHTVAVLEKSAALDAWPAESIVQNLEAGGSVAITRQAYWEIGGMDEDFEGWGGEDNEFWDRCQILQCWIWGYEPLVHLWHCHQPLKHAACNPNLERSRQRLAEERVRRVDRLKCNRS
ncbi:glycosyltransferase family 2 protein [Cyanobium sp. CH-040]|uniref:glycosyltransferase family 2 protein n=1 Tax=Cyanobium sp. CH-040 TaxID=2823708 RepID=UPI0020CC0BD6|nr:galactosyltransferase-related protein [Cyanobium sp. CH-040]MCP9927903.1 glycosyltransferase [Cyanobium sp. CH-040]